MKTCQSKINQSTQKRVNTRNKMEGLTSKQTKEPPKRANHKGNIKFPNPLLSHEAYQTKEPSKRENDKGNIKLQNPLLP